MRSRLTCSKPAARASADDLLRPARAVLPVEHGQHARDGGLHADRDAGEADVAQLGEVAGRHRLRVRLGGDLHVVGQPEPVADVADQQPEVFGRQQRRRAAAEEDRRHRWHPVAERVPVAEHLGRQPQLAQHGVGVGAAAHARAQFGGGVGVEVAVAAARLAERHVDVHAERHTARRVQRVVRQPTVRRRRVSVRQGGRHGSSVRRGRDGADQARGTGRQIPQPRQR